MHAKLTKNECTRRSFRMLLTVCLLRLVISGMSPDDHMLYYCICHPAMCSVIFNVGHSQTFPEGRNQMLLIFSFFPSDNNNWTINKSLGWTKSFGWDPENWKNAIPAWKQTETRETVIYAVNGIKLTCVTKDEVFSLIIQGPTTKSRNWTFSRRRVCMEMSKNV